MAASGTADHVTVVVVDDHPAMRAGLEALLRPEPGIAVLGTAGGELDLWPLMARARPDVVILDYHLPGRNGLLLCRDLKSELAPPAVVLYSAFASDALVLPGVLAGADALLGKGVPGPDLCRTIRRVAVGEALLGDPPREAVAEASARVDPRDRSLLDMLLEHRSPAAIARAMGLEGPDVGRRIDGVIARLRAPVPLHAPPA